MEESYSKGQSFLNAMGQLNQQVRRIKVGGDLPKGMFGILLVLDHHAKQTGEAGLRLGELCTLLHRPMPSITRSVNALEEAGYVERTLSKQDRRAVYVNMTEQARHMIQEASQVIFGVLDQAFDQMGPEETQTLLHLMGKMGEIMKRIGEPEEC